MDDGTPRPQRDDTDSPAGGDITDFASTLRQSVQRRGQSLRTIRRRLRDRGYTISVATLSMWQSGARRPDKDTSFDTLRELEQLLLLDEGTLTDTLGPSRRIQPNRHRSYATLAALPDSPLTSEPTAELLERSGSLLVEIDAESRVTRTVNRTLWQAHRDGARHAVIFYGTSDADSTAPEIRGTLGCDLVDTRIDLDQQLVRATLRLSSPLRKGELALTERESITSASSGPESEYTVVAPRRQAEIVLHLSFDPQRLPRRCRVTVEADGTSRSHAVPLNGVGVTHAEFNFGPGTITLMWDW
ncbi:hypothetical protein ACI2IP_07165 [Microbacterium sp. NPDC090218]